MALFDNVRFKEFLLFIHSINMNIEASGMLKGGANIKYLCTLVHVEALRPFDVLSDKVEIAIP